MRQLVHEKLEGGLQDGIDSLEITVQYEGPAVLQDAGGPAVLLQLGGSAPTSVMPAAGRMTMTKWLLQRLDEMLQAPSPGSAGLYGELDGHPPLRQHAVNAFVEHGGPELVRCRLEDSELFPKPGWDAVRPALSILRNVGYSDAGGLASVQATVEVTIQRQLKAKALPKPNKAIAAMGILATLCPDWDVLAVFKGMMPLLPLQTNATILLLYREAIKQGMGGMFVQLLYHLRVISIPTGILI
jgi:hypothetical protein